jgi:hypothetical protein
MDIFEQIKGITDPAVIKAILDAAKGKKAEIGGRVKKVDEGKKLAEELQEFTNTIHAAKDAYVSKGFNVEIKTNKNGLVTKWSLKRSNTIGAVKTMSVDEFQKILVRLGDKEFSSKDIKNALIGSGIGDRKLQPTLGLILKGMHGNIGVQKVDGVDKGPGVRYIKVK